MVALTKQELEAVRSLVEEKEELEGIMRRYGYSPRSIAPDGQPRGNATSDPTGLVGSKRADLKTEWDEKVLTLSELILKAEQDISVLHSIHRRIVRMYYFAGMSDKRIARKMSMNFDVIGRKRREAIVILERQERKKK